MYLRFKSVSDTIFSQYTPIQLYIFTFVIIFLLLLSDSKLCNVVEMICSRYLNSLLCIHVQIFPKGNI